MARRKKMQITLPALRIDGAKRINLADIRKRRDAAKKKQADAPIEDDRVANAWGRQTRRDIAIVKGTKEARAMQTELARPRKTVVVQRIKNPYFAPEHKITNDNPVEIDGNINIRESAVETLFARGVLDRAQKRAADKFRAFFEAMGGAGASAMDYSKDVVDGGPIAEPLSARMVNAGLELDRCRILLGLRIYDLVRKVCGEGRALLEISTGQRERLTAADNLRHALDDLAEMWNMRTNRR